MINILTPTDSDNPSLLDPDAKALPNSDSIKLLSSKLSTHNPTPPVIINAGPGVSFYLRPFPPPNLVGVPIEYIVTQLRHLAPYYWSRNDTADCTILVPLSHEKRFRPKRPDTGPIPAISRFSSSVDPLTTGPFASDLSDPRRSSAPDTVGEGSKAPRRRVIKLHRDYLCSQSTFFRAMFAGHSPLDLANPQVPKPTSRLAAGAFPVPPSAQPRLMPCKPNHPILVLPLPDPQSFDHIVHYLYYGQMTYIEDCLARGSITWEGIVRNVEYLGLREDIKVFLGRWWGNWLDPMRAERIASLGGMRRQTTVIEEESDGEDGGDEADSNFKKSALLPRVPMTTSTKTKTKRRSLSRELQYPPSP